LAIETETQRRKSSKAQRPNHQPASKLAKRSTPRTRRKRPDAGSAHLSPDRTAIPSINPDSRQYKVLLHMQQNLVIAVRALRLAAQSPSQVQDQFGELYRRGVGAVGQS